VRPEELDDVFCVLQLARAQHKWLMDNLNSYKYTRDNSCLIIIQAHPVEESNGRSLKALKIEPLPA
jgi:hypothetical protein